MSVPISYNHWGDFDRIGMLFALAEEAPALLAQVEEKLEAAGLGTIENVTAGVTTVLSDEMGRFDVSPLVQPLVVRAHLGDCVQFNLTNLLKEPVSVMFRGLPAEAGQGMALGLNAPDLTMPGETRAYRTFIPDQPSMEGAHFFYSGADPRFHIKHGLFGALVAEPKDASWRSPDGGPSLSGTQAMIVRPTESDYREYVVIYHDEIELIDHALHGLPVVDPFVGYGPGTKGINYRSEPFMDRLFYHDLLQLRGITERGHDKSQSYGSYTYGDGAVFMPRAYVGDPTKFRLMNAGPVVPHVHHLHGGGDRWRASPNSDETQFDHGLVKHNPIVKSQSERIDVQMIGPGESFNAVIEGGAGGTQQSVGDFLLHCHIVEHYVAGMWSIWRVHNTLQGDLAELPDRAGRVAAAVPSNALVGQTLRDGTLVDASNLRAIVERQLPPQGVAEDNDASVWDWSVDETPEGPIYLGEPETTFVWPNYQSEAPGSRPTLLFNPDDGRLSYPYLRPHFGKRPPFAAEHGPAPYLGTTMTDDRPDGLCPADAPLRKYNVVATQATVHYDQFDVVDELGSVFLLAEDKAAVLAGTKPAKNLVIRANQGDCVDVLLTSQVFQQKVNMHIHLVQFDVQASDGVIVGFNPEQSVRSTAHSGTQLAEGAPAGATQVRVADPSALRPGTLIGIGLTDPDVEIRKVVAIDGDSVTLDSALENSHAGGQKVGTEFVRYRWYADVEVGTVYWHDHVDGLFSWRRGLFGALIVEPRGSSWYSPRVNPADPENRTPLREGTVADIVVPGKKSFREFVVEISDRTHCLPGPRSCQDLDDLVAPLTPGRLFASFNLRSGTFLHRNATHPFWSLAGSHANPSAPQGDPTTDVWEAYVGDPVVVRLLYGGQASTRAVNTFTVGGHRFQREQYNPGSHLSDAISLGISSQHNLRLECGAGGCGQQPGDYYYGMTQPDLVWRGAWGIFRVHDERRSDLLPLPGSGRPNRASAFPSAPVRHFDVVAMEESVLYTERTNRSADRKLFALASEAEAIRDGTLRPQPLVLRVAAGDILEVTLRNDLDEAVGFHPTLLIGSPRDGLGFNVGLNPDSTVAPAAERTFRWYADKELGAAHVASLASVNHTLEGLFGAVVVEPAGATFSVPTGPSAMVHRADGSSFQEHVLLYESNDRYFESGVMTYHYDVRGMVGINYRSEKLHDRVGGQVIRPNGEPLGGMGLHSCQFSGQLCVFPAMTVRSEVRNSANPTAWSSLGPFGDPETPVLTVQRGAPLMIRALGGAGDQFVVHGVSGHTWAADPDMAGSNVVDMVSLGQREASNAWIPAAGPAGSGDYLVGQQRIPFMEAGAWTILRVQDCPQAQPLAGSTIGNVICALEGTLG